MRPIHIIICAMRPRQRKMSKVYCDLTYLGKSPWRLDHALPAITVVPTCIEITVWLLHFNQHIPATTDGYFMLKRSRV